MLAVPTNVGYTVVASFLLTDEQSSSIEMGLRTIAEWCPLWKPKFFMSDYSEAQIAAIESVFPGTLFSYGVCVCL